MPITKQATVSYVLICLTIDMLSNEGRALIRRLIDGVPAGDLDYVVSGEQLANLLKTPASFGQTLGDQVTDTIYNYLIKEHNLVGVIS